MKPFSISVIFGFAAAVVASPLSNHVIHEKRDHIPAGWTRAGLPLRDVTLPIRIALKQRNLEKGHEFLMDVSDPTSENYGKHWTVQQVAETFAPALESVDAVTAWLVDSGIAEERISRSFSQGWLQFDATVSEAEDLLKTKYHVYKHNTGQLHMACQEYGLPKGVQAHVDFITPTVHFDVKVKRLKSLRKRDDLSLTRRAPDLTKRQSETQSTGKPVETGQARKVGDPGSGFLPKLNGQTGKPAVSNSSADDLSNCDKEVTIYCLHALYNFTFGTSSNSKNSYGIVEYTPQAYLASDLDKFFEEFYPKLVGERPIFDSIDGGVLQTEVESFSYNGESDLDLQYAMALVYPQNVTLYQVGDLVEGASFNNFLDGIDASYCKFEGGDDTSQDGIYPDSYNETGAYKKPEDCGTYEPTKVISTSYGYNEADLTPFYEERCAFYFLNSCPSSLTSKHILILI